MVLQEHAENVMGGGQIRNEEVLKTCWKKIKLWKYLVG